MTTADSKPTPSPAMKRPAAMRGMVVEMTSMMTPAMKIKQPSMMVVRRPKKSAKSPAIRAPVDCQNDPRVREARESRTKEGSSREDRSNEGLVTSAHDKVFGGGVVGKTSKGVDGILHAHDATVAIRHVEGSVQRRTYLIQPTS